MILSGVVVNGRAVNETGPIVHPPKIAALNSGALNTKALNQHDSVFSVTMQGGGVSKIYNSFTTESQGVRGLVVLPFTLTGAGTRRLLNGFTIESLGVSSVGNLPFTIETPGTRKLLNGFTVESQGVSLLFNSFEIETPGTHGISFDGYTLETLGVASLGFDPYTIESQGDHVLNGFDPYTIESQGVNRYFEGYTLEAMGLRRLAGAVAQFELYRGVDGPVDFDTPWETFLSFPHETAALDPDKTYLFVLRYRNEYDFVSQNIKAWELRLDGSGDVLNTPPSAPASYSAEPAQGGKVRVSAVYPYLADGADKADQWLIYFTDDGFDPNPVVDTPTVVSIGRGAAGLARLDWLSTALAEGAAGKAIVRTRNNANSVDSGNSNIVSATATLLGPPKPFAGAIQQCL